MSRYPYTNREAPARGSLDKLLVESSAHPHPLTGRVELVCSDKTFALATEDPVREFLGLAKQQVRVCKKCFLHLEQAAVERFFSLCRIIASLLGAMAGLLSTFGGISHIVCTLIICAPPWFNAEMFITMMLMIKMMLIGQL